MNTKKAETEELLNKNGIFVNKNENYAKKYTDLKNSIDSK
jgi:hypothetical protein